MPFCVQERRTTVIHMMYNAQCTLYIRAVQKTLFSQIITSIRLFVALVAKKPPQKFLSQNSSGQPLRMTTPFFGSLIQVKFRKMAFLARSFHFMFLEPCSFNINGRKAFRLFLVSKLYGHVLTVFWPRPFYADKIAKNGILALSFHHHA